MHAKFPISKTVPLIRISKLSTVNIWIPESIYIIWRDLLWPLIKGLSIKIRYWKLIFSPETSWIYPTSGSTCWFNPDSDTGTHYIQHWVSKKHNSREYFDKMVKTSLPDPWHFETDPDPWIRTLDYGSGSCSFGQWLSSCQQQKVEIFFIFTGTNCKCIYISL